MSITVPKLWPGSTIAVLATGPSLTQEDCDYVRGKARIIAINDAHRLAPFADVLYSSDRHWWPHYNGVPSFAGMKYGIGTQPRIANPFSSLPDVQVLKNTGFDGLETNPQGLRTGGGNSGYAAVNLAVHFGAARILLLGYNMSWPGGKAHFFGNHPSGLGQTQGHYPSQRERFKTMIGPLKTLGIDVINCTANTSLSVFPQRPLRDVLTAESVAA
jgi:hypothetical protein